jgi:hypothetical protein
VTTDTTAPGTEVIPVVSQATMALFAQMAVGIPEANDSEAYENIVLQLLGATDVDGINAPWDTDATEKLAGQQLKIETIERRTSDYAEGLGMFLVCKGINTATGEKFVWSTGSVSAVAQLARAHHMGWFPVVAEIVIADTPTAKGYRPQHLKIIAIGGQK